MAITYITKDNNMEFLEKLGVHAGLRDALKESALVVSLGFSDFRINRPNGETLVHIKLAASSNSIMKGNTPPPVVKAVCGAVSTAITDAIGMYDPGFANTPVPAPNVAPDVENMLDLPVIPLAEAEYLYQPVRGTSNGSKYFLVAKSGLIKVAARVMDQTVSIRVVGVPSPSVKQRFLDVGLDEKGDHLSAHFEANTQATPHKIIGAVLMGTGIPFDTALPSVDYILDKGA